MSTRIVFDCGLNLTVLQDESVVADALRRKVTLEGRCGRPLHINWDQVAFIGPNRTAEVLSDAAHRSFASPVRTRAAPTDPQA